MLATAASMAKRKYNDKNYVHVHLQVKPEIKEDWQATASEAGESLSVYITKAIAQRKEREAQK